MIYRISLSKIKIKRLLSIDFSDKDVITGSETPGTIDKDSGGAGSENPGTLDKDVTTGSETPGTIDKDSGGAGSDPPGTIDKDVTTGTETPGTIDEATPTEPGGIDKPSDETESKPENTDSTLEAGPAVLAPDFYLKFNMVPDVLSPWNIDAEIYPQGSVDLEVADSDRPRVLLWLTGQVSGSVYPPSDKLLKDMSTITRELIKSYLNKAAEKGLFTTPCRMGWAFRFKDGTRSMTYPMQVLSPNDRAPLLPITLYNFYDGGVHTETQITNRPCHLTVTPSIDPEVIDSDKIEAIDIIAGPQPNLIPDNFKILNISTEIVDGTNRKVFFYTRPESSALMAEAAIQNDLRIIASIPLQDFSGTNAIKVTPASGALANWKLLPKFNENSTGSRDESESDNTYNPDIWEPVVNFETEPFNFNIPDVRKSLKSVHLCGMYQRGNVSITLYGSRHREKWIKVAVGKRGWISGLAGAKFQWWKIRIKGTLRPTDILDSLTFDYR